MAGETEGTTAASETSTEGATSTENQQATTEESQNTNEGQQEGAAGTHQVPYSRFKQVNEEKKDLRVQNAELQQRLSALEQRASSTNTSTTSATDSLQLPEPPSNLDEKQRVAWYINTVGKSMIERELGMPVDQVKTLLSTVPAASKEAGRAEWANLCQNHGLDPTDERVVEMGIGFIKGNGMEPEDALKRIKSILGTKPAGEGTSVTPQETETSGVNGSMTAESILTWNKRDAADAAAKGQASKHLTIEEIIEAKKKERAASS